MSDYDYKKFAILYVDDEEKSLKYFTRAFGDEFRVLTAANAEEGYKLIGLLSLKFLHVLVAGAAIFAILRIAFGN